MVDRWSCCRSCRASSRTARRCPVLSRWRWSGSALGGVFIGRLSDQLGWDRSGDHHRHGRAARWLRCSGPGDGAVAVHVVHLLIGLASATFAPLMAEASHWFVRRRGIAVTMPPAATYLAGAYGRRSSNAARLCMAGARRIAVGLFCAAAMALALLVLRAMIRGTNRQTLTAMQPSVTSASVPMR